MQQVWGKYRKSLVPDLLAGVTGAVAGAPQAMGFSIIAGVSPIYGLYTAVVSTIVAAITQRSSMLTVGPTNALALVVGTTLVNFEQDTQIERLFVLTVLVGVFQFLFGVFRLGRLTRFVSNAVMTGFITGAGLLIILGQLGNLTGYQSPIRGVLPRLWDWLAHIPQFDPATMLLSVVSIIIIYGLYQTRFKSMATLVAIGLTSLIAVGLDWDSVQRVRDISLIPSGLPAPILPDFTLAPGLLSVALALAVLASVQSAAISQAVPEPDGSRPDATNDFTGQGIANIAGGFFQGMPAGASLSRTAINVSAGARTRLANITAGVVVALFLVTIGELIEQITMAALAGQLVVAAVRLVSLENIRMAWNVNLSARVAMVTTFISTLVLPLEYSIYLGVVLSLALYTYTAAGNVSVARLIEVDEHRYREEAVPDTLPDREPVILFVQGHLFFAAVRRLEDLLPDPGDSEMPVVILRLRDNQYLGSTGIRFLRRYAEDLKACGGKLILAGIGHDVREQMERTGAVKMIGEDSIFYADKVIFNATEHALTFAREWLEAELKKEGVHE